MLLLSALLASPATAQESSGLKFPSIAFVAVQALDLHSTHIAISNGHAEGNAIMRGGTAQRVAIKAGTTAATIWIARTLERKGRPRAAKITLYAMTAVTAGIAAHNYSVVRR